MKIILARHGKPALQRWPWLPPAAMVHWVQAYDQAGVIAQTPPPAAAVAAAHSAAVLVCSTAPRALDSIRLLGRRTPAISDAVFSEVGLPQASWRLPPLPPVLWAALLRLLWLCGYCQGGESLCAVRLRAQLAAQRLIRLAEENGSVFLLGHGIMNQFIAKQLRALGWQGPPRPAWRHWQFSVYRKEGPSLAPRARHRAPSAVDSDA